MSFDSCKEDIEEGYPCECGGSVTKSLDRTKWECDLCDFTVSTNGNAQQQVQADSAYSEFDEGVLESMHNKPNSLT